MAEELKKKETTEELKKKPTAEEVKKKPAKEELKKKQTPEELKKKPTAEEAKYSAVGRRKEASARVTLMPGKGEIKVNKRAIDDYFPRETLRMIIQQPFKACNLLGKYDIIALVR